MRKQTTDLQNYELKKREDIDTLSLDKQQDLAIKEDIIADGIKDLFFQIITEKKENEGEGKSRKNEKKERELVSLFIWGDENEYGGDVPILITMRVSFWNNSQTDGIVFENAFPVYSYPTQDLITTTTVEQKEEDKKNESQPKEKQEGTGEAEK